MTDTNPTDSLSIRKHAVEIGLSWLWFFLVLLSYYCLKPVRDGLASDLAGGLGNLYLATFISSIVGLSIYSRVVAVANRIWLVAIVYNFFILCLVGFAATFAGMNQISNPTIAVFFVWVSVFNLFVVTLFWSVMADLFSASQAKAWFGIIAAAGSIGSISGSLIALQLSNWFGTQGLITTAIIGLELSVVVAITLIRRQSRLSKRFIALDVAGPEATAQPNPLANPIDAGNQHQSESIAEQGTGGSIFAGFTRVVTSPYLIGICLFVAIGKFAATFIYNNLQLSLSVDMPNEVERMGLFSQINLYGQSGSLITQAIIAGWIMKRLGVTIALLIPSVILFCFFGWLSLEGSFRILVVGQVLSQVMGYGLLVPAQHALFTVVSREDKYKSKAFTDIVVFRGSDVAAGKICDWLIYFKLALTPLALAMGVVMIVWSTVAVWTGRKYQRLASAELPAGQD
ncbi:MAG: NTP/NDP exchange transporter [Aureliella sp.]